MNISRVWVYGDQTLNTDCLMWACDQTWQPHLSGTLHSIVVSCSLCTLTTHTHCSFICSSLHSQIYQTHINHSYTCSYEPLTQQLFLRSDPIQLGSEMLSVSHLCTESANCTHSSCTLQSTTQMWLMEDDCPQGVLGFKRVERISVAIHHCIVLSVLQSKNSYPTPIGSYYGEECMEEDRHYCF